MPPLATMLDEARGRLQAGEHLAAERLCRQVLQGENNAGAWCLLGEALSGQGRLDEAVHALRQVVALQPGRADGHYQLGVLLARHGQAGPAAASYREALRCQPRHAEALTNLGVLLAQDGRLPEAVELLRRAIATRPTFAKAHHNLGVALAQQGQLAEAAASLRQALAAQPDYAEAHFNLANTLRDLGQHDEALASFYRALQYRPDYPEALNNLGLELTEQGQPAAAIILLRQALRLRPDFAEARNNLGLALAELGQFDEAVACYEHVLAHNPRSTDAHTNLGSAYKEQGRLAEAVACYDQALRYKPDAASTHWNRALAWLQQGDYARGWAEYEWRWQRKTARPRSFRQPRWDGTPLAGRTILLWCEQGLGDAIQFVRYAPLVRERGGRVLLECPPPLKALFASVAGVEQLLVEGEALPPFDVHAPLMSLPYLCQTTLATVPAAVPYLHPEPERVERWRSRLPVGGFRVGVVWQGNARHKWDRHRSFPVQALAPLADLSGVQLISLQKGHGLDALRADPPRFPLALLGDDLDADAPFVDTAAVLTHLDLVVTADTSVAHLAGALGVPVWVALGSIADWRWLLNRAETPWYPTMRLFRRQSQQVWEDVFQRVAVALERLVRGRQPSEGVRIPVTPGELLDKLTILEIKLERLQHPKQLANVRREYLLLTAARAAAVPPLVELEPLVRELRAVNAALWQAEDDLRDCERRHEFGADFVRLARSVYYHNDHRAALKRQLNERLSASLVEEKSYAPYAADPQLLLSKLDSASAAVTSSSHLREAVHE